MFSLVGSVQFLVVSKNNFDRYGCDVVKFTSGPYTIEADVIIEKGIVEMIEQGNAACFLSRIRKPISCMLIYLVAKHSL